MDVRFVFTRGLLLNAVLEKNMYKIWSMQMEQPCPIQFSATGKQSPCDFQMGRHETVHLFTTHFLICSKRLHIHLNFLISCHQYVIAESQADAFFSLFQIWSCFGSALSSTELEDVTSDSGLGWKKRVQTGSCLV